MKASCCVRQTHHKESCMAGPPITSSPELVRQIAAALWSLEHGHVQITIHDSRVVEIATTEKKRFHPAA